MIELRPYQSAAGRAVKAAFAAGQRRVVVTLPTGTGKTVLGLALACSMGRRLLWVTHREELLEQTMAACERVWPRVRRGLCKSPHFEIDAEACFASVQTLTMPNRLQLMLDSIQHVGPFALVIVDEAHHATAPSYVRVLNALGSPSTDGTQTGPPLVGLTATIERSDGEALDTVFEGIAYRYDLLDAIRDGYLVPFRSQPVALQIDWSRIHSLAGDFRQDDLAAELLRAGAAEATALAVAGYARERKTIVFTVSVNQAERTAAKIRELGIAAEVAHGEMDTETRRDVIGRFRSGETRVVCNAMLLTEGFDEPAVSCIAVARPTQSKLLYLQMIGRGTRLYPGKEDLLILDLVGAGDKHGAIQAADLHGNPELAAEQRDRTDAAPGDTAGVVDGEIKLVKGYLSAATKAGIRRNVRWVQVHDWAYAMSVRDANIILVGAGESWRTVVTSRGKKPWVLSGSAPVTLEMAQGLGEDHARKLGAFSLVSGEAAWRNSPVTDRQVVALEKWKIAKEKDGVVIVTKTGQPAAGLTMGEASDLMLVAVARAELWRHKMHDAYVRGVEAAKA